MIPHNPESRECFAYLADILVLLCEVTLASDEDWFEARVDRVASGIYRIDLGRSCAVIVDSNRIVTDDPECALPEGVPGRLPVTRGYRVHWRDRRGLSVQATTCASSRRFARYFVGAPEGAHVERA